MKFDIPFKVIPPCDKIIYINRMYYGKKENKKEQLSPNKNYICKKKQFKLFLNFISI